jgi:hypothetical protein
MTRKRVEVHIPMQMEKYRKETGRITRRVVVHITVQMEMYMYEIRWAQDGGPQDVLWQLRCYMQSPAAWRDLKMNFC